MTRRGLPRRPASQVRYRRSPALVLYWSPKGLACFECTSGRRFAVAPEVIELLNGLGDWCTPREFRERHQSSSSNDELKKLFETLVETKLLQREDGANEWPWSDWSPEAAFFHFGTKGGVYTDDLGEHDRRLRLKARHRPPPPPTKVLAGPSVALPDPDLSGDLPEILRSRRTWRTFSKTALSLDALSTLLQLTWGVQRWGMVKGQGRVALKTSPSGGSRHPIEAYVLPLRVGGLRKRVFHYDAGAHRLVDLQTPVSTSKVIRMLASQTYFSDASALIVMSAVFARSMWRYPSSRAYRVVLADAGHLGQTFCLVATAMGLAPFCTMAFHDRQLDALIGVDGVEESALYVVGVGSRPQRLLASPGHFLRGVRS